MVHPHEFIGPSFISSSTNSPLISTPQRVNFSFYISRHIIPSLQRIIGLAGGDLQLWFNQLPRPAPKRTNQEFQDNEDSSRRRQKNPSTIDQFYALENCLVCGEIGKFSSKSNTKVLRDNPRLEGICEICLKDVQGAIGVLFGRSQQVTKELTHLNEVSFLHPSPFFSYFPLHSLIKFCCFFFLLLILDM